MRRSAVSLCSALTLCSTLTLSFALLTAACGSRAGLLSREDALEPSADTPMDLPTDLPPADPLVEFPSIEETASVPDPAQAPEPRPREDAYGDDPTPECDLAAPSLDTLLERVLSDVMAQPAEDRSSLRYVSASFSLPKYCRMDTSVNVVADAMPLLLNSLSLTQTAAGAEPLDGAEGLLRIDLREMGWDRPIRIDEREHTDGWEALGAGAAQSVALRGPEADALFDALGTRTPLLHAHDLSRAALRADLYYALLESPQTLGELRSAVGIPPELQGEPNAYWRAVTTDSKVSRQDRVVLRYRGEAGSPLFWHTLDRRPEAAADSAFIDPLAREGDESSVMYTLPNGLPAYFLAAADGRRLDESSILVDFYEDDFVPRTAPSCVRCHSDGGVLPVVDELRAYAATDPNGRFGSQELALIDEVYPPQKDLDALIEADRRRVEDARARLGVPRAGSRLPLDELVTHYALDLAPAFAAAELFTSPAELERRRGELPGPLRVLTSVGSLSRQSFNATYREALCALTREARNQPVECP
jgi:hypothetical protein